MQSNHVEDDTKKEKLKSFDLHYIIILNILKQLKLDNKDEIRARENGGLGTKFQNLSQH